MNQNLTPGHYSSNFILRVIIVVYLLLFIAALTTSGYLLSDVVNLKPIILIDLLKYILLCFIFFVLLANGVKALSLKQDHLLRLESSVKNFKWLFVIALLIGVATKFGLFRGSGTGKLIEIPCLQIGALIVMVVFCFWSHAVLVKNTPMQDDEEV